MSNNDELWRIVLNPNSWDTKRFIDSHEEIHLGNDCHVTGPYVEIPITRRMMIHYHFEVGENFERVMEILEEVEEIYEKKVEETRAVEERLFEKIFNSPFLDKAPPDAIKGQTRKLARVKEETDEWEWMYTFILNQEISWLSATVKDAKDVGTPEFKV